MTDYTSIDAAIVKYIAAHPGASPTNDGGLRNMACDDYGQCGDRSWRLIDRRLQAMRKAGRIVYAKATINRVGGWRVLETEREG